MKKTMFILRGPSGAGKGHYIQNNIIQDIGINKVVVCSADDYFNRNGEYDFDAALLPQAHQACMSKVLQAVLIGHECIVVDNTHTRYWEYENYVKLGKRHGYKINILELVPETLEEMRLCAKRNVHNVPASVIAKQCMRFEYDDSALRLFHTRKNLFEKN